MSKVLFILVIGLIHSAFSQDFSYDGPTGPEHWGEQFNQCVGKHQSPINIDLNQIVKKVLPPLQFQGFDTPVRQMNLTNNGHTVQLTVDEESLPKIMGGPLHGVYQFAQLHFHWGDNDTFGSEDTIAGHRFPMELHIVFYKQDYMSSRGALSHEDGLTVLAFFYELSDADNELYNELIQHVEEIQEPDDISQFEFPPNFNNLLPRDLTHYFTYNGSLTTPPCSEVVTWIDFKEPVLLSHNQLEVFRRLRDHHNHTMTHNFRPVQPLGDREVWFNLAMEEYDKEIDLTKEAPYDTDFEHNVLSEGRQAKHDDTDNGVNSLAGSVVAMTLVILNLRTLWSS